MKFIEVDWFDTMIVVAVGLVALVAVLLAGCHDATAPCDLRPMAYHVVPPGVVVDSAEWCVRINPAKLP